LLTGLQQKNSIADYQPLFISMTEEVCRQVLANNYAQSLCLSLDQWRSAENSAIFLQLAERLEAAGFLDRLVESFPQTKAILSRPGQLITRPELAVLMAAGKMYLTRQIESQVALLHDECCECYLQAYFPEQVNAQYKNDLSAHPLANEIKATIVSNKIINQAGCGFLNLDSDSENANILDHAGCYLTFDRVLEGDALRLAIYGLDNKIAADIQYRLLLELEKMLAGFCRWALSHNKKIRPVAQTIDCYNRYLQDFEHYFKQQDSLFVKQQLEQYLQDGVPEELAQRLVFISSLNDFPFIVSLSAETATDFVTVFKLFDEISHYLGLNEIHDQLAKIAPHDYWEQKVSTGIQADIKRITGQLLNNILSSKSSSCASYFDLLPEKQKINRYRRIYQEIMSVLPVNLMPYIALTKELEKLLKSDL
jgi:glutamate dehydrogenase